ncbi:MAG TPA: hypothetical protein VLH56_13890, partial [Dissulfurispiraceae bacterium]|nr:hypothetical protein [Dissulfurispiraceae bacterium]
SLCGSAGSISGDVLTWIDPSFSILEPLRESFLAVHFASRVFQQPANANSRIKRMHPFSSWIFCGSMKLT